MSTSYYAKRDFPKEMVADLHKAIVDNNLESLQETIDKYNSKLYNANAHVVYSDIPIQFHIGTKSAGWRFLWQVNFIGDYNTVILPFTKKDIRDWFEKHQEYSIFDEYGRKIEVNEFLDIAFDEAGKTYHHGNNIHMECFRTEDLNLINSMGFDPNEFNESEFFSDGLRFCVRDFS